MHKRDRRAVSVRSSVTFVHSVKTRKRRVLYIFFTVGYSHTTQHTILVFHSKRYGNIATRTSNARGVKCRRRMKKTAIFDQYIASSRVVNDVTVSVVVVHSAA